jgi:hypothetical protein
LKLRSVAELRAFDGSLPKDTAEIETGLVEKSSPGTRQTDSKNLVWIGEIERNLAKLSIPTFTYRSSSYLFYVWTSSREWLFRSLPSLCMSCRCFAFIEKQGLDVIAVSTAEKRQVLFAYSSTLLSSDHDICASSV